MKEVKRIKTSGDDLDTQVNEFIEENDEQIKVLNIQFLVNADFEEIAFITYERNEAKERKLGF